MKSYCYKWVSLYLNKFEYKKEYLNIPIKLKDSIKLDLDKKSRLKEFLIEVSQQRGDHSAIKTTHEFERVDLNKELKDVTISIGILIVKLPYFPLSENL